MRIMNFKHICRATLIGCTLFLGSCEESLSEKLGSEAKIMMSFKVTGANGKVFNSTINDEDNTITIKVAPQYNASEELSEATPVFYLSKGATVTPDPAEPQNFAQEGGVKYTVTSEDRSTTKTYTVGWGISDKLPEGAGFSYAEKGIVKFFPELGYPGEKGNFDLPSEQYGDLEMYHAYCGDYIVLLSRVYVRNGNLEHGIKVVDKNSLESAGTLNLGSINADDLKMISSDYKGHCVGCVVKDEKTEFVYWTTPSSTPISVGTINVNMAPFTGDAANNFQISGDITTKAWITALAPRDNDGSHYRIKVSNGQLASDYSMIKTNYPSNDCNSFQMIAALDDSDEPAYIVGDGEGTPNTANSIHCYVNSFTGSTLNVMPKLWQNTLQTWWVGTGFTVARSGGHSPIVSVLPINGKTYTLVTSGTAWWHAAAVLDEELQELTHENLNIAIDINRGWSYGAWADWYWDDEKSEAYLALWFGRVGLFTYKMTCFE